MSLKNAFKNDCPLTIPNLEKWLLKIIDNLPNNFTIEGSVLKSLYTKNENAIVDNIFPTANVIEVVTAIAQGVKLQSTEGISILCEKQMTITSDDYYNFKIVAVGAFDGSNFEKVVFELESLMGSVRLSTKTISEV